ncbi:MAG: hypothetical protein BWY71_00746 [Planctomycetes bacterium ADurb.Bin412]|nr:MAG: hypothetical protein BWY71_00746 [Planctomycetes bacterium ADurb.Bin412]
MVLILLGEWTAGTLPGDAKPIELFTPKQEEAFWQVCDDWQFPIFLASHDPRTLHSLPIGIGSCIITEQERNLIFLKITRDIFLRQGVRMPLIVLAINPCTPILKAAYLHPCREVRTALSTHLPSRIADRL